MKRLILSVVNLLLFLILMSSMYAHAEGDTSRITLQEAETQFLQKNLSLIAQKYNIDINKAQIKQAKLWDNPNFSISTNIYDGSVYPFYHGNLNNGGEVDLQWSQLFRIGGEHKKLAAVLSDNASLSEQLFNDLMNSLRFTLRSDFYSLASLVVTQQLYIYEREQLQPLVKGMESQFQNGNISSRDNMRIKALDYGLKSDLAENEKAIIAIESEFKQLLHANVDTFILPVTDFTNLPAVGVPSFIMDSLYGIAMRNRPDYKAAEIQSTLNEHNLHYQKSLAVPDLTVGVEYDKNNSYAKNYVGLNVGLPLPLFNRNQVNVEVAKLSIEQQNQQVAYIESKIRNDVYEALKKLSLALELNNLQQSEFGNNYDDLFSKMVVSYREKQVNLIEFIDFLDAYKSTKEKMIRQAADVRTSIEALNYACGTTIINNSN